MLSSKRHLLLLGLIPLSFASQANDMQFLQAANYYANSCIQQHGTPYLSPDQGVSWHQIDLQEIASSAEHQKSLAVMNGRMSKEKVTKQQINDYINQNVAAWAKTLEKSGSLTCQVGSGTVVMAGVETLSAKQIEPRNDSNSPNPEWQKVWAEEGLEYYIDPSSDTPLGFGRITAGDESTLIRVSAQCSNSSESYQVTLLDAQGNDVKTSTYKASDNEKIMAIKNTICSDSYGRNYQ